MQKNKRETLSDKLRAAIAESGLPHREIERETGVLRQSLLKFVRGEQSLRLDMAEKLIEFFGIGWQPPTRKPKRPTK